MKHCPFNHYSRGIDKYFRCHKDCALWVESEKMCSFRLLVDEISINRELARIAAAEAAARGGTGR